MYTIRMKIRRFLLINAKLKVVETTVLGFAGMGGAGQKVSQRQFLHRCQGGMQWPSRGHEQRWPPHAHV